MNTFLILLKRELQSIIREKTIMFAIMLQFFIASLSSIILVGLMAFYDPTTISQNTRANIRIGIVEENKSPMQTYLEQKGIRVFSFASMEEAQNAFNTHRIDAIMEIPKSNAGVVDMKLTLPRLDTTKTVIMMVLQEPLKEYENYLRRANGVKLHYDGIVGKTSNTYEFLYSVIIPVLMLFPALIAGSIMIDTVAEEFENKTFDTLIVTPVTTAKIFFAKISAAVITAMAQVILWTFLLRLNGLIVNNPLQVIIISVIVAVAVSLAAAFIGLYFKDRERAQFIYSMFLVIAVGASCFTSSSPLTLITMAAANVHNYPAHAIVVYLLVVAGLGVIFFTTSGKLISKRI